MAAGATTLGKRSIPLVWRIAIEVGVAVLLFAVAVWIGWLLRLDQQVSGGSDVRRYWLGLLVLLLYLAIRLGAFVFGLRPGALTPIPDIDAALNAGFQAMDVAGVSVHSVPLHLVVGTLSDDEEAFRDSPKISKSVQMADPDHPVHFYGGKDGLWVTIPGVSAVSKEASVTSSILRAAGWLGRRATTTDSVAAGSSVEIRKVPPPRENVEDSRTLGVGAGADLSIFSELSRHRMSAEDKNRFRQRVEYVAQALRRVRHPYCPVNSITVVFQWDWLTSKDIAHLIDALAVDMTALQQQLGVQCLCLVVVLGMEASPDFAKYVKRLNAPELERRLGCGLPKLSTVDSVDLAAMHGWVVRSLERQILELCQRDIREHRGNRGMYRLLDTLRASRSQFDRLIQTCFGGVDEPFYFGGVYFASSQKVAGVARPFFDAVLTRVHTDHDEMIGWNDQAVEQDRRHQRWAVVLMVVAAGMTVFGGMLLLKNLMRW